LPGFLAERIDPELTRRLAAALPNGSVLVTGTNGKTTTTRILVNALKRAGLSVITNPEGSNLTRGIATSLLARANRAGSLDVSPSAIGVFEVDEGAFPHALEALRPRLVVITNLFRDQLDRYFEVDFVAELWRRALRGLSPSATLVLNADDPQVAHLGELVASKVLYYGIDDKTWARAGLEHVADSRRCPRCGTDLLYELSFYAHLGHYACGQCGWRRPNPRFSAWKVSLDGLSGSHMSVTTPAGDRSFEVPLAGLYNACNTLSAAAAAAGLGVDLQLVQESVSEVSGAFGRLERFDAGGRQACLILVKNPSGFNEGLRLVLGEDGRPENGQPEDGSHGNGSNEDGRPPHGRRHLLLAVNDNGPDGRDVSWIWDVDFELCRGRADLLVVSGQRARDVALRLHYARVGDGDDPADGAPGVQVEEDVVRAFWMAIGQVPPGETLYVLITYTAMWTLRKALVRKGYVAPFFEQVAAKQGARVP
jgi:UDP-N-acetylmuramyl tripeptide synthase